MKPQLRRVIQHKAAEQSWPGANAETLIRAAWSDVRGRLGYGPPLHFPASGDYWFAAEVPDRVAEEGKGLALVVSVRLPHLWFVFGRLFIKGGRFYRRQRGSS